MVSEVEKIVGMETFFSEGLPGIGGKLKETPADFIVDEISIEPRPSDAGKFTIARIRAVNWESNKLIREMARQLRVNRANILFAGTKDKRAITTQIFSIPAPVEKVTSLDIHGMSLLNAYSSNHSLRIGRLIGNKFDIMLRRIDLPREETRDRIEAISERLREIAGYPNFFGLQRFGAVRPVTHTVGRKIILKDFRGAVVEYLGSPCDLEDHDTREARKAVLLHRDFQEAFELFPKSYTFERMMLYHLIQEPGDYPGALRKLPRNLVMMFTHANQSYMFNRIISRRIREGLPIHIPVEGDIVLPETRHGLPSHSSQVKVNKRNIEKVTRACLEHKAYVSGMIYGADSEFPSGEAGEIERSVIEEEKLDPGDFMVPEIPECSSTGTRKEICAPFKGFSSEAGDGWARFLFSLNKGCYATSLMREFMKCKTTTCY